MSIMLANICSRRLKQTTLSDTLFADALRVRVYLCTNGLVCKAEIIFYCAYRNSMNNAFLRLFRYVRTDRTMTIRI